MNIAELFQEKYRIENKLSESFRKSDFLEKLKKHLASSECIFFPKEFPISSYKGTGLAISIRKYTLINSNICIDLEIEFVDDYHDNKNATYAYLDGPIPNYFYKTYKFIYPIEYETDWEESYFKEWLEKKKREIHESKYKWILTHKVNKEQRFISGCENLNELIEMVPDWLQYEIKPEWKND